MTKTIDLITDTELHARHILNRHLDGDHFNDIMIKSVFWVRWQSALTLDRINAIAVALNGFEAGTDLGLKTRLDKLAKDKVLRIRREKGKTLYEINFGEAFNAEMAYAGRHGL